MNKSNNIDMKAHYFVLMHPVEFLLVPGYGVLTYISSNTREKWVECEISVERFKAPELYKLDLVSVEPGYGLKSMYVEDFLSALEDGRIVKKLPNMKCVEEAWEEPLTKNVNVRHSAYTLKIVK